MQQLTIVTSALRFAALIAALAIIVACGSNGATTALVSATSTALPSSASPTPEVTKPPFTQAPLPAPTHVSWAIDHSDQPGRHLFELHYDGAALGFRIVDGAGRLLIVLPIAGSGIFGPDSCMATAKGGAEVATWVGIDDVTYQELLARGPSYRVEVDTIGHGTITLPLVDTGCRRS